MSEPIAPGVHELPEGDRPGNPLTRVVYSPMLPDGQDARAGVDLGTGTTVMVIRPGLSRRARREAVRAEFARLQAWRGAALVMFAADLGRRGVAAPQRAVHLAGQLPHTVAQHAAPQAVITWTATAAVVAGIGGAAVAGGFGFRADNGPVYGSPQWHREHPVHVHLATAPLAYLGVYAPPAPDSYAGVESFAGASGRRPNLALYYSGLFEPFRARFAAEAAAAGAVPVVQINPVSGALPGPSVGNMPGNGSAGDGISLAAIAAGAYDSYLVSFADQVASFGRAVVLSFAPEVNGNWYPWSAQSPASYIAAWRHVVTLFRRQGAGNVTWMMTYNRITPTASPDLVKWWPGSRYVDWVGIDGYYEHPRDTWAYVFAPAIGDVQQFTQRPILISETAVGQKGTRPRQLTDMYTNIKANSYLGLIWFDKGKYRLEGDPGAESVFRAETAAWKLARQRRRAG